MAKKKTAEAKLVTRSKKQNHFAQKKLGPNKTDAAPATGGDQTILNGHAISTNTLKTQIPTEVPPNQRRNLGEETRHATRNHTHASANIMLGTIWVIYKEVGPPAS